MALYYLILVLLVQCSLSYADLPPKNETESIEPTSAIDEIKSNEKVAEKILEYTLNVDEEKSTPDSGNTTNKSDIEDILLNDFRTATNDWVDMYLGSDLTSTSTSMMAQAAISNKSPEEQLEEIKEVASEITMAIQNEMTNLLSYALNFADKDVDDSKLRKRRSIETPMDSSQLVMRLLKHIKSNNEYQNIAIEKMMSAQEIADKYGVDFNPDPEILSDLAFAANEQAKELSSILHDACDTKNSSCMPEMNITKANQETIIPDTNVNSSNYSNTENMNSSQSHEHVFQPIWDTNHVHYGDNHVGYNYYSYPQSSSPVHSHGSSVSPKPTFYDSISYNPNEYYGPYCSLDPMAYPIYSFDDPLEPELVGEEYEEIVSSKVIIEQDEEPGSATVNHVMTYTVSEKAHFRAPQIENLPQQMQYYFYLM